MAKPKAAKRARTNTTGDAVDTAAPPTKPSPPASSLAYTESDTESDIEATPSDTAVDYSKVYVIGREKYTRVKAYTAKQLASASTPSVWKYNRGFKILCQRDQIRLLWQHNLNLIDQKNKISCMATTSPSTLMWLI